MDERTDFFSHTYSLKETTNINQPDIVVIQ